MSPNLLLRRLVGPASVTLFAFTLTASAEDFSATIAAIKPSVVQLTIVDEDGKVLGVGTGFFVAKGQVATNWHVAAGGSQGYATLLDGTVRTFTTVEKFDRESDVVVIGLGDHETWPAPLPMSDLPAREGESVLVIGNPKGIGLTSSEGIVSAVLDMGSVGSAIQFTAPISPGSSGSPLIRADGTVIGIVTAFVQDGQNLNFAVPVSQIKRCGVLQHSFSEWARNQVTPTEAEEAQQLSLQAFEQLRTIIDGKEASVLTIGRPGKASDAVRARQTLAINELEKEGRSTHFEEMIRNRITYDLSMVTVDKAAAIVQKSLNKDPDNFNSLAILNALGNAGYEPSFPYSRSDGLTALFNAKPEVFAVDWTRMLIQAESARIALHELQEWQRRDPSLVLSVRLWLAILEAAEACGDDSALVYALRVRIGHLERSTRNDDPDLRAIAESHIAKLRVKLVEARARLSALEPASDKR